MGTHKRSNKKNTVFNATTENTASKMAIVCLHACMQVVLRVRKYVCSVCTEWYGMRYIPPPPIKAARLSLDVLCINVVEYRPAMSQTGAVEIKWA